MAERKRSPGKTSKEKAASSEEQSSQRSSGSVRWLLYSTLVILTALLIYVYTRPKGPQSVVSEAASSATPEVAERLIELDGVVTRLIETFPEDPAAFDVMGWLHYKIGKVEHAGIFWKHCLELDKNFAPAHHALGLMALELGEYETAETHFRRNVELDPSNSAFKVELAQALVESGKSDEAIEVLLDDLRANPKAIATAAMLGHAYLQVRDFARAKHHFETVIELGPDYTNAYKGMVDACRGLGERELAIEYAKKLQEKKALDTADHRQMLQEYDDTANISATVAEIYTAAANVYLAAGDPQTAEEHFLKALDNMDTFIPACEILAWLYKTQGRTKRSADMLRQLLANRPKSLSAHLTAGSMFTEMEYLDEAEEAYRRAITLTPKMAGGYAALANFLLQARRKLPEAKELAEKAARIEPVAPNFFLLAVACQATNDLDGARDAIGRAAELEPLNQEYLRLRQFLSRQQ
jgi:tetratricopeptide (TPR) repeat protein